VDEKQWKRIEAVFDAAIGIADAERESFLDRECAGDDALRAEVLSLLQARVGADEAISSLATSETLHQAVAHPPQLELQGTQLGVYRVGELLGEGGSSLVFRGYRVDEQFERQVAIKVLKWGFQSIDMGRRFADERRILAQLDHPGIARILDGGTSAEGLQYFVMEFVDGEPIDSYCDRQLLSVAQRIELFEKVCDAVHYAHRNLVVHRDLKPANILVSREGVPKLLDFGIAKLLEGSSVESDLNVTQEGLRLLSPLTASPEQVRGEAITTATDVYSLGVVLYQLLSASAPYRLKTGSLGELERVICSEEPRMVSTQAATIDRQLALLRGGTTPTILEKKLRGDLDWILIRALEKVPGERYPTADAFATDLRAHRRNQAVSVGPRSRIKTLRKLIQRNPVTSAIGISSAVALSIALVIISVLLFQTSRAREDAEHRFDQVHELVNALLFDIHGKIEELPGSTAAREYLVQESLRYLNSLREGSEGDRRLRREVALAFLKIGDVQGNPAGANLGNTEGALTSYQNALELLQDLQRDVSHEEERIALAMENANALDKCGEILVVTGETDAAEARFQDALIIREGLKTEGENTWELERARTRSFTRLAHIAVQRGDGATALEYYDTALSIDADGIESRPHDEQVLRSQAVNLLGRATVNGERGELEASLVDFAKARATFESLFQKQPLNAQAKRDLGICAGRQSQSMIRAGRLDDAVEPGARSSELALQLFEADPESADARREYQLSLQRLGVLHTRREMWESALQCFGQAAKEAKALLNIDAGNQLHRRDLWVISYYLTEVYLATDGAQSALRVAEEGLRFAEELYERDPENQNYAEFVATSLSQLSLAHEKAGDKAAAIAHLEEARKQTHQISLRDRENVRLQQRVAALDSQLEKLRKSD